MMDNRTPPNICQECQQPNELDQWYEAPRLHHLLCSSCANKREFCRPVFMRDLVARILQLKEAGDALVRANDQLSQAVEEGPDLTKQLRRLTRELERGRMAQEQSAKMLTELVENLSPRWAMVVPIDQKAQADALVKRLSTEAGPGAILKVTPDEMDLLAQVKRL